MGVPQPSTVNSGRYGTYGTYGCGSGTTCSPWRGTCAECGRNEASPCVEALLKAWMGSEFGSGGIVVVHAVTIMTMTDGSCVFSIKNIGQDSMVGHFKIAFVIF